MYWPKKMHKSPLVANEDMQLLWKPAFKKHFYQTTESFQNSFCCKLGSFFVNLQANIRAIRAKFFAEGLREYTGIQTASTPPSQRRAPGLPEVSSC